MNRRVFLRRTALVSGALACGTSAFGNNQAISLILDPSDPLALSTPVRLAARELELALLDAGFAVRRRERIEKASGGDFLVVVSGATAPIAAMELRSAGLMPPREPESLVLFPIARDGARGTIACGADHRGLVYAVTELTDRVRHAPGTGAALKLERAIEERPANPVRSIMRQFTSETLDKPWFYDREMWPQYLAMLAQHRFNRFHLAFGLGYDALQQVADSYLLFPYPFLISVPGYNVRATNLSDAERDRNLETLRFISEQTAMRGIEFQLGIWMHGYQWIDSPRAQNTIDGLTPETHAAYCRDALTAVLRACPAISAVALRIHGESGIKEGSYDFWKTVFDGVKRCGRTVEIDLHAKGIDGTMIGHALATGMPVNVSPKYWAEHLGMPYHQAAIRDLEMPVPGHAGAGLMTLSEGARVFTRYGYADLLRDDRKYTVRHRVFSGTQRLLLWGDPAWAAAYSRMFQFCGSNGADLMEPLTCRGRRGTATSGRRSGYVSERLEPRWDWQKYTYWYRIWGRLMYNPDPEPQVWRREFAADTNGSSLEKGLAQASRILPIVTTAHLPSAACDAYWPEIYWNQPMVGEASVNPYTDSPAPKVFQNVSPLDPQTFSRISDFADELLTGESSGKYSPVEVAQWLEDLAEAAEQELTRAGKPESIRAARLLIDAEMQTGLGRFFAAKFRAGILYSIYEHTGDKRALEEAIKMYSRAQAMWARVADKAKGVYAADLSASDRISERGQWMDRLAGIEDDIAQMRRRMESAKPSGELRVSAAVDTVLTRPRRITPICTHRPPEGFRPGHQVTIEIALPKVSEYTSVHLMYRHVNQAERYQQLKMELGGNFYSAGIPSGYTDSAYPLQYYFILKDSVNKAWLYPGFRAELMNQPYFLLRRVAD
jgi:hypothetical protein